MIQKTIRLIILILINHSILFCQKSDRVKLRYAGSLSYCHVVNTVVEDVGGFGATRTAGGPAINNHPIYERKNYVGLKANAALHVILHIPVINKNTWSAGIEVLPGFGFQAGYLMQESWLSYVGEVPIQIYHSNPNFLDGTRIFAGGIYRYAGGGLTSYVVGIRRKGVEIYLAPYPIRYYYYLTNGDYERTYAEWGIGVRLTTL